MKVPYQGIADQLGVTSKAVTHRIANIRKTVMENRANMGNSGGSSEPEVEEDEDEEAPAPVPKKRKRAAPAKKAAGSTPPKKGGKKGKVIKSEETVEENAEDEQVESGKVDEGLGESNAQE